ncbi:MAG: Smr/MutS family protein [Bacteroidia bacterium]
MLKLGDRVKFVNENMEGIVTSFKQKNLVGVTIEDDFEIPVMASEVVKIDFDDVKPNNDKKEIEDKLKPKLSTNPLGIFWAYNRLGENEVEGVLHNNACDTLLYVVYQKEKEVYNLYKTGKLSRGEDANFLKLNLENYEKWNPLLFQFILADDININPSKPLSIAFKSNPKEFHQSLKFCFFLQKQSYMFKLNEEFNTLNLNALKQKDFAEKTVIEKVDLSKKPEPIIDLHFDKLLERGYTTQTNDIIGVQMDVFIKTLEAAYVHQMKSIVYVHGIGNQYLKNKIHTFLTKNKRLAKHFEDADSLKFGGGATYIEIG